MFRWQGILPILVVTALAIGGWLLFGERIIRATLEEAATKALGAQFDLGALKIRTLATTVELERIALADPFDRNRNLFEVGRAMAEVQRFAKQFKVPLLSLTPIDSLKALVLDPTKLKAVQAALSLASDADSAKVELERRYAGLRVQETLDSSAALVTRLQGTNVRTLGVDGARRAVADVRRAVARVDSAKARVESLLGETRRRVDTLRAGVASIDAARREDYEFARGLLKLPSLETPDIGAALFGPVTIDKFEQAVYWSTLAQQYAPPGLLPKKTDGPERMRMSGTTVHFATPQSYPRFLIHDAQVSVTVGAGTGSGNYQIGARAITTDPGITGLPMIFAIRRTGTGSAPDSLRITGSMDHTGAVPREIVNAQAGGVQLPLLPLPALPYTLDPGRGMSELRFALDGKGLFGRWSVRSSNLAWRPDSARARSLNAIETLVARVLTGIRELELTADIGGSLEAPTLAVRSNLDRQVADRLRTVVGEEVAAAQARVRAQVDRLVEEKSAPVKARIEALRAEGEQRVADARARLDDEKRKLEERLKALSGGLVGLPRLPAV
jgi:uncharacterized protein (TIGR03545 family)